MKGELHIIDPRLGFDVHKVFHRPRSDLINSYVGELITIVPLFDHFPTFDGQIVTGIAFANQEAHILKLPDNLWATAMWHYVVRAQGEKRQLQILKGPVVFVSGDTEFMEEL